MMGLFDIFKKKAQSKTSKKEMFFEWLDTTLMVELPSEVKAINFNLYEDAENTWSIELVGTSKFDENDDDWACCEVFSTRENPFVIEQEGDWQTVEEIFEEWLSDYLANGKLTEKMKQYKAVGMGFVGGDLTILFKRENIVALKTIEYYLLPETDYRGGYDRKEGHFKVKRGTVADMIHDSSMLWISDYDKVIPSVDELNRILREGAFPRLVEWDPLEIDEEEYDEIVRRLTAISMLKPYRVEKSRSCQSV